MTTHTTPATALANSEQTAEPSGRASRFDQRGIALQTVIIMVVLLAIAGTIAAVLLNRGGEAADQLQSADFGLSATDLKTESSCRSAGHGWDSTCMPLADFNNKGTSDATCKGFNPRWEKGDHAADGIGEASGGNDCVPK